MYLIVTETKIIRKRVNNMQKFEKRLKYERYKNMNNIISIDLHNGYTTIAIIGRDENGNYDVELRIKENTVEKWDLIEKAEHVLFDKDTANIHSSILRTVSTYLNDGFFQYYIERYKYELKCFDIGNEVEESKRLDDANVS